MATAPYNRAQAVKRAKKSTAYAVGMCMQWTRIVFGIGAVGDYDGDGDADAVDGWKASKHRHPGDRNPPAGVPVFWSGGTRGHGHAAVSLGGGKIRSIDRPRSGVVGTVPLDEIERAWGLKYLGWAEDINGTVIPKPVRRYPGLRGLIRAAEVRARSVGRKADAAQLERLRKSIP